SHRPSGPRWWRGEDLNPRRRSPADLQSAPFGQLGYLAIRTVDSSGTHSAGRRPALVAKVARARPVSSRWSWRRELNPRPAAYKAAALPLSYASKRQNFILCIRPVRVNPILVRRPSVTPSGRLRMLAAPMVHPADVGSRTAAPPQRPPRSATPLAPLAGSAPRGHTSALPTVGAPGPRSPRPGPGDP